MKRAASRRNIDRAGTPSRRDAGFSLLELMVVVVILSILALVTAPIRPVPRVRNRISLQFPVR